MQKIKIKEIQEGQQLEQPLFCSRGKLLLAAHVSVTAAQLTLLKGLPDPYVYLAESLDELIEAGVVSPPANYKPSPASAETRRVR